MKKLLLIGMLIISANAWAISGRHEFVVRYPDEELRFIHDNEFMYVLQEKKNPSDRSGRSTDVKCGIAPIKNGTAKMGPNTIEFHEEFALVNNKKRHYYTTRKTDLLFYRDICPRKPKN